jgi:hypothetical protein
VIYDKIFGNRIPKKEGAMCVGDTVNVEDCAGPFDMNDYGMPLLESQGELQAVCCDQETMNEANVPEASKDEDAKKSVKENNADIEDFCNSYGEQTMGKGGDYGTKIMSRIK